MHRYDSSLYPSPIRIWRMSRVELTFATAASTCLLTTRFVLAQLLACLDQPRRRILAHLCGNVRGAQQQGAPFRKPLASTWSKRSPIPCLSHQANAASFQTVLVGARSSLQYRFREANRTECHFGQRTHSLQLHSCRQVYNPLPC